MSSLKPEFRVLPREVPMHNDSQINLLGLTRAQLTEKLSEFGTPKKQLNMRTSQIWQWLYVWGVNNIDAMTNLSKKYRDELKKNFVIAPPELVSRQVSGDGTRKYLLRIEKNHEVEAVYIPDEGRGTLCISSQVGCTLTCSFCHTGTQRLVRNLTSAEIVGQIILARHDLEDWPVPGVSTNRNRAITNLVLMGMGEPLFNFENVRDALNITMDGEGIALSRKRITLSTAGIVSQIARTAEEIGCLLAVSLHATTDQLRDKLVPINRKWNIQALFDALRSYPRLSNSERITFEYVMLNDINDREEDAIRLVDLIKGIPAKVNLIPFNEWPGSQYRRSSHKRMQKFAGIINRAGYASPIRTPRGEDILAACGQLKSQTKRHRLR
ncbi:MAG: 23S rRNA (adenine(2503)-C(2))-methyltransferase RlmN [Aestuariivita sp.]|nr:23S rRNA (adenine(2503)-C(2))-methyltransferase RlmN [Aestuariivita sp.]